MKQVFIKGVITKAIGGSNTFITAIGSRFYLTNNVPENPTFPFAILTPLGDEDDWTMNSNRLFCRFQIDIFSDDRKGTEITTISDYLHTLFDYKTCILTVSGYNFVYVKRILNTIEHENEIWQDVSEFESLIHT